MKEREKETEEKEEEERKEEENVKNSAKNLFSVRSFLLPFPSSGLAFAAVAVAAEILKESTE